MKTYQHTFEHMEWSLWLADVVVRVGGDASRRFNRETDHVGVAIQSCLGPADTGLKDTERFDENRLCNARVDLDETLLFYSHPPALVLVLQMRTPLGWRNTAPLVLLDRVAQRIDLAGYHELINAVSLQAGRLLFDLVGPKNSSPLATEK